MNEAVEKKAVPAVFDRAGLPDVLGERVRQYWRRWLEQQGGVYDAEALVLPEVLPQVWAFSDLIALYCTRSPGALGGLLDSGDLERAYATGEMLTRVQQAVATVDSELALGQALRRLRLREMVRIAWRDLSAQASLDETLRELSALADACVDGALSWLYAQACARDGVPRDVNGVAQSLVVLGMGKLGGGELNFSSDIDLIFAFEENGKTDGPRGLENQPFFVRLGQHLIKALDALTEEGFVFRVDMRLRPFGEAGPIASSFAAMEDYYQRHGRDWERYALIKARVIGGDQDAGARLLDSLRPFIYRRYLDYGAFAALREMKALINSETARKGLVHNIKLGSGGIREIEFIGQAFQLIRGGRDPQLQCRGIRQVIPRLVERNLLPDYVAEQLLAAYAFLRRAENHLQMWQDRQTHQLPSDEQGQLRLALSMGFDGWPAFELVLSGHMRHVREHFSQVFAAPQTEAVADSLEAALALLWAGKLEESAALATLTTAGYEAPQEAFKALELFRQSRLLHALGRTGRARLDQLMPLLIAAVGGHAPALETLKRVLALVVAVARRSVYLSLLVEYPLALSQVVRLCAASPWVAAQLARHPLLLDELLDPRSLYAPPDKPALAAALSRELERVDADDLEQIMDRLRVFKQAQVLRVAAADLMGAMPLMQVSDQLSWIAEAELQATTQVAWHDLCARYGRPQCLIDGQLFHPGFAIIGYGKLGGYELGYGSDLDLVFLHDSAGEAQHTDGPKALDNATFFARLGQRIVHMLTALTPAGLLYEVDTRLRPSGAAGMLVSSLKAFAHYQENDAWTWEHQALVRARAVAGSSQIAAAFTDIRAGVLERARDPQQVRDEVREMREKMWRELSSGTAERFDLKKDPGGIADIEFMVQYMVLAHAHAYPALGVYTDNIRILKALADSRLLSAADARLLSEAFRVFRDAVHALTLQALPGSVQSERFAEQRAQVRQLWQQLMQAP